MNQQSLSQNYSRVVNLLIFIFPIVIISMQVAGDIVLFVLAMMGIYIAISRRLSPFAIKEIEVFSYLTFGYFIAICLSVVFSGQVAELAHYIPRDFYFLFAPFIALSLYKADINLNYLLNGLKITLLLLGVISYIGHLEGIYRPSGVINPAIYANIAVSMFIIVFIFLPYSSLKNKIFSILSLLSGLIVIVAAGTRGAWLTLIFLFVVYLFFLYKQKTRSSRVVLISVALMILGIFLYGSMNEHVKYRLSVAYDQITYYHSSESKVYNPITARLTMYEAAIDNIEDVPFFGHGLRTSNITLFKNNTKPLSTILARFNHLHNGFLTSYYNGGIVSLSALLLLLFLPLRIFMQANSQNRENPIFIAGALIPLGFLGHGMFNILLGDTYMNGSYIFFLALFLLLTNKSNKTRNFRVLS